MLTRLLFLIHFAKLIRILFYSTLLKSGVKNSLQSLILVNAAVKITCLGHSVTFKALNENGKQVLKEIHPKLTALGKVSAVNFEEEFSVQFSPLDNQLDEDSKLQSATIFDGLRVISTLYQHSQTPIFLGGLFAYDLVANFIPMDGITLQHDGINCPDYSFYLAEHLITIDHQNQQATLKKFLFCSRRTSQYCENLAFYRAKTKKY